MKNVDRLIMKQQVYFKHIEGLAYKEVWDYQEHLLQENTALKLQDDKRHQTKHHLLFVKHNPVYTLGKNGSVENILISEHEIAQLGIEFFHINRGGDITYHGPGQLVGYPIFDLDKFKTDLNWYLRNLEEVIIKTLQHYGIQASRSKGETGVWIDPDIKGKERKICAIGIKCSRWVTMHGFAFNINTPLHYFDHIIPCGIKNKQVTSLRQELGREVDEQEVHEIVLKNMADLFDVELITA